MASTTCSIVPFPGTQPAYNNNNNSCTTNNDYYYNNIGEVAQRYAEAFAMPMPPNIARQVNDLIVNHHVEPAMICEVIDYATDAPRPSWRYARAVINAKIAEGITTSAQWQQSVTKWYSRPASAREPAQKHAPTVIEQRYGQREYTPGKYNGLTDEQYAEMARMDQEASAAKVLKE